MTGRERSRPSRLGTWGKMAQQDHSFSPRAQDSCKHSGGLISELWGLFLPLIHNYC